MKLDRRRFFGLLAAAPVVANTATPNFTCAQVGNITQRVLFGPEAWAKSQFKINIPPLTQGEVADFIREGKLEKTLDRAFTEKFLARLAEFEAQDDDLILNGDPSKPSPEGFLDC